MSPANRPRTPRVVLASALALALALALTLAGPALAGPWWRISSRAAPTHLAPGSSGLVDVAVDDLGNSGVSGEGQEITITDVLPAGLSVSEAGAINAHRARVGNRAEGEKAHWKCTLQQSREVSCSTAWAIPPYELLELEIPVTVDEPAGTEATLQNEVAVSGGQAPGGATLPAASLRAPIQISAQPVDFGVEPGGFSITPEGEGGAVDTQAGSHPYQLTSTLNFNQVLEEVQEPGQPPLREPAAPALAKNLSFELPPGLLGAVTATERCSALDFAAVQIGNSCPAGSAVGVATVTVLEPSRAGYITLAVPLFNLQPAQGEPARFGFVAVAVPVVLDTALRSGSDYGVSVSVHNATEAAQVLGARITFWGDPDAQSHDSSRGWGCLREGIERNPGEACAPPEPRSTIPLLTLPTSCQGPLSTSMLGQSWGGQQIESSYSFQNALQAPLEQLEGCSSLPFEPSLEVSPQQQPEEGRPQETTSAAATPTGLNVNVRTVQAGTLSAEGLADADLRSAKVTLPAGMLLSPAAANGLEACSESQIGYLGPAGSDPLAPGAPQPLSFSSAEDDCPLASKIGTVSVTTPLLAEELKGSLYLAAPAPNGEAGQNPFDSLLALYIVAENKTLGLRVKLAGQARLDETDGQIETSFTQTPQVPFEELRLQIFGGPRGSLSTPALCGSYAAQSSFESWSGVSRNLASQPPFAISSGPGGEPCLPNPQPFAPNFAAGSMDPQAGAFTPFSLEIQNPDGNQALSTLALRLPTGIAALLSSVSTCEEPEAARGQCGAQSLIGHSLASSGLGPDPIELPGSVYLTGPYGGAPFGIEVVTPAKAGPFDLGDVIVRSKIEVDPHTAAVTIASDPFPTFIKGVPAQLKAISVQVDRGNFEFNPTSCEPKRIEGSLSGANGGSQTISVPFQVQGCQNLPFKPEVKAQTQGKSSKANGASLSLKFKDAKGQANVAKTLLTIPSTLPARLTTIQKACLAKTFEANPASCPEGSVIGSAIVHTPVLKSPLQGPIYLVSHGNAAWPDAELVLQGEGITVILDGQTAIKKGVTTSSFASVPDAPFESLEANLPEGPHSALTANLPERDHHSFCGQKLQIPIVLSGQNGAQIQQKIAVSVQGCAQVKGQKAKKLSRAQKLKTALVSCRKRFRHSRPRRSACEGKARRLYGPRKASKAKEKAHKGTHRT